MSEDTANLILPPGRLEDCHTPFAKQLVEGRTIVTFERENDFTEWTLEGENSVTITLSDGAKLHFVAFQYDGHVALATEYEAPDVCVSVTNATISREAEWIGVTWPNGKPRSVPVFTDTIETEVVPDGR